MISVIVPVYNVEKYLNRCIESIVNQTYSDLEIILVNDGSTDSSGAICDEWASRDLRVNTIHKTNGGLSSARNAGLDICSGDYVTFVDSDDYISLHAYEKAISAINAYKADICQFGVCSEKEDGTIISYDRFTKSTPYTESEVYFDIVIPLKTAVWNKIFHRRIIENHRFVNQKVHGEDLLFFLQIYKSHLVITSIDYIGYHYVKHKGSITGNRALNKHLLDEIYCKDTAYQLIKEKYPNASQYFEKWCFQARLNILRKIYRCSDNSYTTLKDNSMSWLCEHYTELKSHLSSKQTFEYFLLKWLKPLYKIIIKHI